MGLVFTFPVMKFTNPPVVLKHMSHMNLQKQCFSIFLNHIFSARNRYIKHRVSQGAHMPPWKDHGATLGSLTRLMAASRRAMDCLGGR